MQMRGLKNHTMMASVLLSAIAMAGCASGPSYDDDTIAERRCPRDYKIKCTKRSAEPEKCSCVPSGDIEELIEAIINPGIN